MFGNFAHYIPVKLVFGPGQLARIGAEVQPLGTKALIVTTGTFFQETGLVERLQVLLNENGVSSCLYSDVDPNPLNTQIDLGAQFALSQSCDIVIDALTHAIEAYTSRDADPISDLYCEEALRLIGRHLRCAVANGQNLENRTGMALASTLAGFGIAIGKTTICHALGHSIGGMIGAPHGETMAALTPHSIRFSMEQAPRKYRRIGLLLSGESGAVEDYRLADSVDAVENLIQDVEVTRGLSGLGVEKTDFEEIADGAFRYMADCLQADPADPTKADLIGILEKAF